MHYSWKVVRVKTILEHQWTGWSTYKGWWSLFTQFNLWVCIHGLQYPTHSYQFTGQNFGPFQITRGKVFALVWRLKGIPHKRGWGFLWKKKYNTQGVDLLVTVAAHILNLNIRVFQEEKATGYINITQHINNKNNQSKIYTQCKKVLKITMTAFANSLQLHIWQWVIYH